MQQTSPKPVVWKRTKADQSSGTSLRMTSKTVLSVFTLVLSLGHAVIPGGRNSQRCFIVIRRSITRPNGARHTRSRFLEQRKLPGAGQSE